MKNGIRKGSRGAGRLLRGSQKLAPSTRLPLSRDCIPGLPSLGLARSQLSSSRLPGRALMGLGRQAGRLLLPRGATPPAPPPNRATPGPIPAWGSTPGLRWGMEKSGCSNAEDRAGQRGATRPGRTSLGSRSRRWRSLGPASGPGPSAHSQAAAAGRLRAERKPRAQTGRGGWCERLGPVPARRGWNTMSRAGGRAGERGTRTA